MPDLADIYRVARPGGLGATRHFRRWRRDRAGSVVVIFAIALPVMLGLSGMSVDYIVLLRQRDRLQSAADAGVLAAARELSLADSKRENVQAIVEALVEAHAEIADDAGTSTPAIATSVGDAPLRVEAQVTQQVRTYFGGLWGQSTASIGVTSAARVIGQPNICLLGLDPSASGTISLDKNAHVIGRSCAVFSNSTHTHSIASKLSSILSASLICSAGGKDGSKANFTPDPITDCPTFDDPLAGRPEPTVGACLKTGLVVSGGMTTLAPGTYCGGLTLTNAADVRLQSGVYVIKDGPLKVEKGAKMQGVGVGFFLTGPGAVIDFDGDTTISLEADKRGAMAGLLFFEARSQSTGGKHTLLSDNAQTMVGTVYLSRAKLFVGGSSRIGGESAYTAIVARTIELTDGPIIVLNTNYEKTDVPVPDGIKGAGQPVALMR